MSTNMIHRNIGIFIDIIAIKRFTRSKDLICDIERSHSGIYIAVLMDFVESQLTIPYCSKIRGYL